MTQPQPACVPLRPPSNAANRCHGQDGRHGTACAMRILAAACSLERRTGRQQLLGRDHLATAELGLDARTPGLGGLGIPALELHVVTGSRRPPLRFRDGRTGRRAPLSLRRAASGVCAGLGLGASKGPGSTLDQLLEHRVPMGPATVVDPLGGVQRTDLRLRLDIGPARSPRVAGEESLLTGRGRSAALARPRAPRRGMQLIILKD